MSSNPKRARPGVEADGPQAETFGAVREAVRRGKLVEARDALAQILDGAADVLQLLAAAATALELGIGSLAIAPL
jgi:hypothetical protein